MTEYIEGHGGVNERRRGDDALMPVVHAVATTAAFDRKGRPRQSPALCGVIVSIGSRSWDPSRSDNHCRKCARKANSSR